VAGEVRAMSLKMHEPDEGPGTTKVKEKSKRGLRRERRPAQKQSRGQNLKK